MSGSTNDDTISTDHYDDVFGPIPEWVGDYAGVEVTLWSGRPISRLIRVIDDKACGVRLDVEQMAPGAGTGRTTPWLELSRPRWTSEDNESIGVVSARNVAAAISAAADRLDAFEQALR